MAKIIDGDGVARKDRRREDGDDLPTYEDLARDCNALERRAKIYGDALRRLGNTFEALALGMPKKQRKLAEAMAEAAHECRAALRVGGS